MRIYGHMVGTEEQCRGGQLRSVRHAHMCAAEQCASALHDAAIMPRAAAKRMRGWEQLALTVR